MGFVLPTGNFQVTLIRPSDAWVENQRDPDNWLQIPDFGILPVDVLFEGFAVPIVGPADDGFGALTDVRRMVAVVRSLARKEFSSLRELQEVNLSALDRILPLDSDDVDARPVTTSAERAALRYSMAMGFFETAVTRHRAPVNARHALDAAHRAMNAATGGASVVIDWLIDAPLWLDERVVAQRVKESRSKQSSAAAKKRHFASQAAKEEVINRYRIERHSFTSKDEAATAYTKYFDYEFGTLRDWLKGV